MIQFSRFVLDNGLRLLVHEDSTTPMAAVNLVYDVGSRDESPEKTGFAHLFEHLMFSGSANAPNYDEPLQNAGGECNAFTNSDLTNFYDTIPVENLEVALWLEADRMASLRVTEKNLSVQRKVVVEEFKETCLNEPYGDVWHLLSDLTFVSHPYRWPTIGLVPGHVQKASLDDVRSFYLRHYHPANAILVVAGNVLAQEVKTLVEKWFGKIPAGSAPPRNLPAEPPQLSERRQVVTRNVTSSSIYMAFRVSGRLDQDFYTTDLLTDLICNGQSSRLFRRLLKEQQIVASVDCYLTGTIDPGLLIIEAKPSEGVSIEAVEAAIWKEIDELRAQPVGERELQKVKNKLESNFVFSEMNVLNKAINLAYYELIGDADHINVEIEHYLRVSAGDIQQAAQRYLVPENCSVLHYLAEKK